MARILAAIALSAALAASTVHAEDNTPLIQNPVWLEQPNASDFAQNFPSQAAAQGVEGRATIECLVRADGTLNCHIVSESPASWGFGDATLTIARKFRVGPATRDGVAVEGGRIRRTIRFVLPDNDEVDALMTAEERATTFRPLDLPNWEEAPTTAVVLQATPPDARSANLVGRGVLSCRANADRTLRCETLAEMPRYSGFGAAALSLASHFRISGGNAAFVTAHADAPFILPITFGGAPDVTPVNRFYSGMSPLEMPRMRAPQEAYPPSALAARISGSVTVLCTVTEQQRLDCAIEHETPANWGFGEVVAAVARTVPFDEPMFGFIPGDQIRFPADFIPY